MSTPIDSGFVVYVEPCPRKVIAHGPEHEFRVEVPWDERERWFVLVRDVLAEHGGLVGCNAVLNFEVTVEANLVANTVLCTGTARFALLAPEEPAP